MSTPLAIKLTICIFYVLGYLTFVWLMRHLKVEGPIVTLLALVWILNGFFIAHLPGHFTFIWFLVTPGFIHLALRLRDWLTGVLLGLALALMALAQLHYSFVLLAIITAVILAVRLIVDIPHRKQIFTACLWAFGIFVLLAGHRIYYTLQYVASYSRMVIDPVSSVVQSVQSFSIPYSYNFGVKPVTTPYYGWPEQTVYPSTLTIAAFVASLIFAVYLVRTRQVKFGLSDLKRPRNAGLIILLGTAITFVLGLGGNTWAAPYHILKALPFFSQMRISARWFIFAVLGLLLFIGVMYAHRLARGYHRWLTIGLVGLAVLELGILNFGYQAKVLKHPIARPPVDTSDLTFQQQIRFGESPTSPDGIPIRGAERQYMYREYESTLFNIGTLLANEVFVDLYENKTPKCSYVALCGLVLSDNAKVTLWSPNKIVLKRTAPGKITLNMNDSNYLVINGERRRNVKVVERFSHFALPVGDSEQEITLVYKPGPI